MPPTKPAFEAYLAMLEGCPLPWSAAVVGGDIVESGIARMTIERGGHLHVGLEDWAGPGQPDNEDLVTAATTLCSDLGRPMATRSDTAEILGLPIPPDCHFSGKVSMGIVSVQAVLRGGPLVPIGSMQKIYL